MRTIRIPGPPPAGAGDLRAAGFRILKVSDLSTMAPEVDRVRARGRRVDIVESPGRPWPPGEFVPACTWYLCTCMCSRALMNHNARVRVRVHACSCLQTSGSEFESLAIGPTRTRTHAYATHTYVHVHDMSTRVYSESCSVIDRLNPHPPWCTLSSTPTHG